MCFLNHDLKTYCEKTTDLNKERVWAVFSISTQGVIHLKSAALATKDDSDGEFLFEPDNNTVTFVFVSHVFLRCRKNACSYVFRWRWFKELANSLQLRRVGSESLVLFLEWWLEAYIHITRSFCFLWLHTFGAYHLWHGEEGSWKLIGGVRFEKTRISWLLESILEILCFFICISCISILEICFPSFNMYPWFEKIRLFQPIRFPPTHLALQGGTRLDERHATFGSFGTQESCCVGGLEGGAQRNFRVGQSGETSRPGFYTPEKLRWQAEKSLNFQWEIGDTSSLVGWNTPASHVSEFWGVDFTQSRIRHEAWS